VAIRERVFEHFHLSLIEHDQSDMFIHPLTREEWLRTTFSETFSFYHMAKEFHWVPKSGADPYVVGIIERIRRRTQHKSPEEGAVEFVGQEWQGAMVIIDPRYRPDGQKVAFENKRDVGQPHAILASLTAFLNTRSTQYSIHVKPIFDSETFRRFAARHGNVMRYVTFDFVVPNMFFGARLGVKKGLERVGTDTGAEGVKVTLDSDKGVRTDSQNVEDALEYSEQGNARVTAAALTGEKYSSTANRRIVKMRGILNAAELTEAGVRNWLRRALGRDQDDSVDSTGGSGGDTPVG
jgi:hypothetical protein